MVSGRWQQSWPGGSVADKKEFKMKKLCVAILVSIVLSFALVLAGSVAAQRAKPIRIDLSQEKTGRESAKFLAVVGNWSIVDDGGTKVLAVDGRQWLRGQPAGSLAEKARAIYGARNEEFIDNVKAWAYFPYAVAKDIPDFQDGDISIRFKIVAGQLDECAGILFNLKPNGDYLTVRFNGMEDNTVLWTFNKGTRKFVKRGTPNVPLAKNQWHTLQISVHGTNLQASLNGRHLLDYTLTEPVSGKVGVWSKTDSVIYFDDFTVTK
jgi:Laminin G domain